MTQWHHKGKRTKTGAMRTSLRRSDKRLAWKGGDPVHTTIAQDEKAIEREKEKKMGNSLKVRLKKDKFMYATDAHGKTRKLEILAVVENDADRQFARRNVITKGAVVKAKSGDHEVFARVTSRPGQHGTITGKILEKYEPKKAGASSEHSEKPKKAEKRKKQAKRIEE
ncbi:MAG: hypothetical protein AABW99_01080 [archaeon]